MINSVNFWEPIELVNFLSPCCKIGGFMQCCCPSVCLSRVSHLKRVLLLVVVVVHAGKPHRGCPRCFLPHENFTPVKFMLVAGASHDAHKRIALALKSNEFKSLRDAEWIHSNCYRDSVDHCNTLIILHTFALSLEAQYLPFQQILPTLTLLLIIGLPSSSQDWTRLIMLMSLFLFFFLLHFLFILCGRLIL